MPRAAEDKGGYAKAMGEDFYRRQRELLANVLAEQNVVITTAAVPGKKAPILITARDGGRDGAGSVIVDIAAERGGNCELTQPARPWCSAASRSWAGQSAVHHPVSRQPDVWRESSPPS